MNKSHFYNAITTLVILLCSLTSSVMGQTAEENPAIARKAAARVSPNLNVSPMQLLREKTPEEKASLKRQQAEFQKLAPQEQRRIRKLHHQLSKHEESAKLHTVMQRYYEWLATIDTAERNSLLDLPPEERLKKIEELKTSQARERYGAIGTSKLDKNDTDTVIQWLSKFMARKRRDLMQSEKVTAALRAPRKDRKPNGARGADDSPFFPYEPLRQVFPDHAIEIVFEEIDSLQSELSERAQTFFDDDDLGRQKILVRNWIDGAIRTHQTKVTRERYEFYETLPESERKRLDRLDSVSFDRKLHQLYLEAQRDESAGGNQRSNPRKN